MANIFSPDPVLYGTSDGDIFGVENDKVRVTIYGYGGNDTIEQPTGNPRFNAYFDGGSGYDSLNLAWISGVLQLKYTAEWKLINGAYGVEFKVDGDNGTDRSYHATVVNGEGFWIGGYFDTEYSLLTPYFALNNIKGPVNLTPTLSTNAIDDPSAIVLRTYSANDTTFTFGSARDVVTLYGYHNKADLGAGDDIATVHDGYTESTIDGGAGNDIFVVRDFGDQTPPAASLASYEYLGNGLLRVQMNGSAPTPAVLKNFENLVFSDRNVRLKVGTDGIDTLRGDIGRYNVLVGGNGNDVITGVSAGDTLLGSAGDDLINAGAAAVDGNLLVNGSFESNGVASGKYGQSASIAGWTALKQVSGTWTAGGMLEIWNNFSPIKATDGTSFLELDCDTNMNAVAQSVKTVAGQQYKLTLDFAARLGVTLGIGSNSKYGDAFDIYWNGTKVGAYSSSTNNWTTITAVVTGTGGMDALAFFEKSAQNDAYGILIDHVTLTALNPADTASINVLDGGTGRDTLVGSVAIDRFVFDENGTGSTATTADVIRQFTSGSDVVDVSKLIGGTRLYFGGSAFSGIHGDGAEVVTAAQTVNGKTGLLASIDVNADRTADYAIFFEGATKLTARDFGIA